MCITVDDETEARLLASDAMRVEGEISARKYKYKAIQKTMYVYALSAVCMLTLTRKATCGRTRWTATTTASTRLD